MPVSDVTLNSKLSALLDKENDYRDNIQEIRKAVANLTLIKKVIEKIDDGAGGLDKILVVPIDSRTNKKFTDADRQKIYDDNITEADRILNQ